MFIGLEIANRLKDIYLVAAGLAKCKVGITIAFIQVGKFRRLPHGDIVRQSAGYTSTHCRCAWSKG